MPAYRAVFRNPCSILPKAVELPSAAYFYLEDALPKTRIGVVEALTRIEASQLPVNTDDPDRKTPKTIGLTYGHPPTKPSPAEAIPYAEQRDEAVRWFYEQNRFDAALLSLKRTMIKYPQRYAEARYVERLFQLYHQLALHGFLLDETRRLLQVRISEPFDVMVHRWHEVAKEQLIIQD